MGIEYSQKIISCFQEDMGPISKIFKMFLNGSSAFVGARLFQTCQTNGFRNFAICKNNSLSKMSLLISYDFEIMFGIFESIYKIQKS